MADLQRDLEDALAKLSELVRLTPGWEVDIDREVIQEQTVGEPIRYRETGWSTVTIRYFVDPRTHESRHRQSDKRPESY